MRTTQRLLFRVLPQHAESDRQRRGQLLRRIALALALGLPQIAMAVVCQFTTYMPSGKYPVGHAIDWTEASEAADRQLVQWWFPADPVEGSVAAFHVYSDYLNERMQGRPLAHDESDPEQQARIGAFIKAKRDRGINLVRFTHLMAATMLAPRESTPRAGDWPVLWLEGDPSFGDQLASHGFIVVSSPALPGSLSTQDERVQGAHAAIEATRTRFQSALRRIGFIGFREGAPLAARISGTYPQAAGLALIGNWTPLETKPGRKEKRWLDPAEIHAPTLQLLAGEATPPALAAHPLRAPFSAVTRVHYGDIEDVHLELGLPESCVTQYVDGRVVKSLTLMLAQREIQLRLARFFAEAFDVKFEPAPLKLLPAYERQRQPLLLREEQLSAKNPRPPGPTEITELLNSGGVDALLRTVPKASMPLLPTSWWNNVIVQIHAVGEVKQIPQLLDAWQNSQPGSALAAVHRAALTDAGGADATKLWKQARRLLKSDQGLAPAQRIELATAIKAALKSSR